jgi:threonine synthase
VETATGQKPVLPPHMADLMTRPEKMQTIDANADAVKSLVLARKRSG